MLSRLEMEWQMFYFSFVFLFISLFLLITNRKDRSTKYFIFVMFSYTFALFFMMIYLAKDTYFNNSVMNYFSMPLGIWKILMFLPVNKEFVLCAWNLATLAVPYFSLCFALSFTMYGHKSIHMLLKRGVAMVLISEYIIYHPLLNKKMYFWLYSSVFTVNQIDSIKAVIHIITLLINVCIISVSIIMLIFSYQKVTPLKIIRHNVFLVVFSYMLIMGSYLFLLGTYPTFLIKVSKIADYVSFLSVPMQENTVLHMIFPYYLMGMVCLVCFFLYRYNKTKHRIEEQTITLSKQIAASDTTSKVFCHYMKNELLAVQSELETLVEEQSNTDTVQNAIVRCQNLYNRLDIIHSSTKASELYMTRVNIFNFFEQSISNMSYDFAGYDVVLEKESTELYVMIDENYFEQALHNVYLNAIDAIQDLPNERKKIIITIKVINNWVAIFIKDFGMGIPAEDLQKIFTPFYTSHPLTKHWGIGLTLTHKIISAHEGYIEIESKVGCDTTVKIMLPLLH